MGAAGFDHVALVEHDARKVATLARNGYAQAFCADVGTFDYSPWRGAVDLLAGENRPTRCRLKRERRRRCGLWDRAPSDERGRDGRGAPSWGITGEDETSGGTSKSPRAQLREIFTATNLLGCTSGWQGRGLAGEGKRHAAGGAPDGRSECTHTHTTPHTTTTQPILAYHIVSRRHTRDIPSMRTGVPSFG